MKEQTLSSTGHQFEPEGALAKARRGLSAFARGSAVLRLPLRAAHAALTKCRRAYWLARRRGEIGAYLRTHTLRKLNIGSGSNPLAGWLNADLFPRGRPRPVLFDASRTLPLPDRSFDYVFTEHMIEHIPFERGLALLRECHRVLKEGGTLRVATPDLRALAGLCRDDKTDLQRRYVRWSVDNFAPGAGMYEESFVVNNFFRNWGHKFIYDEATLRGAMERAGFVGVVRRAPGESDDEHLRGIESHGGSLGSEEINRFETVVLEARRP